MARTKNKTHEAAVEKAKPAIDTYLFEEIEVDGLSDKHKLFCMEYIKNGFNGTKAAISAGYNENCAKETASYLLTHHNIRQYVDELKADLGKRIGISAEMIALEMAKIAFSNVKSILNDDGTLKPLSELNDAEAACISSIETEELFDGRGRDRELVGYIKKIKLWNKQQSLSDLNVMLGYNKENSQNKTVVVNISHDGIELQSDEI